MANGTAAAHLLLEPEPTAPASTEAFEAALGAAMADAVVAFSRSLLVYRAAGRLDGDTRLLVGEQCARVVMMQLGHPGGDDDFVARARVAARHVLHQRHGPVSTRVATGVDELVGWTLDVVAKTTAFERAFQRAMAN